MARRLGRVTALTAIVVATTFVLGAPGAAGVAGSAGVGRDRAAVPAPATPLSITYSGSFDMTNIAVPQKTTHSYVYHLDWNYAWSGTWGRLFPDKTRFSSDRVAFSTAEVSGNVSATYRDKVDGPDVKCTMEITSDRANRPTVFASYDSSAGTLQVTVEAPTFRGSSFVGVKPRGSNCAGGPGVNVFGPPASFNPLGEGGTLGLNEGGAHRYDRDWKWTHAFAGGEKRNYTATIRSVLKVTTPATTAAIEAARDGLRQAIERAKGPCAHLAISLAVLATGAVWTSVGAAVPGGIPAGAAVIATGDLMASATAPLCAPLIKDIIIYYSLLEQDPPVSKATQMLRLSTCERWQGKTRAYCERLSAALRTLVAAENNVAAVAAQVQGGVVRLAAARKARNAQAARAAEGKLSALTTTLKSAQRATTVAGAQVERIVKAAGIRGRLTKVQSAATIRSLLANLARQGVPSSRLQELVPGALAAKQTDILAALAA